MLASLGASVYSIEEVRKYGRMAQFLVDSFGLSGSVHIDSRSPYHCNVAALRDRFDAVYFPGVLYHLSGPVLGLRILYNMLRDGGEILLATAGIDAQGSMCRFDGSLRHFGGNAEHLNRGGWNCLCRHLLP